METFLVILILFFKDLKSIFLKERNENDTTNNNYFFKKYLFTDMIIYIHVSNSHIINLKIVSYFTKVKWGVFFDNFVPAPSSLLQVGL